MKKFFRLAPIAKTFIATMLCLLVFSACSTNGEENAIETTKPVIALNITETTTTIGSETTGTIDKDVKSSIASTLSRVLINGITDKNLFTPESADKAVNDFPDNSKATKNKVDVSLHLLEEDNKPIVIVAQIKQNLIVDNISTQRNGKIYFDSSNKITGFDIESPQKQQGA